MSWFVCHRSEAMLSLLREDPKAMNLLLLVACRARYTEDICPVTGLGYGQAFIGDFREAGIETRQIYRLACKRLFKRGFLTIQGTNKGTIATLLPQDIFSVSMLGKEPSKEPTRNHQGTNKEPLTTRKQGNEETNEDPSLFVIESQIAKPKKPRFNPMTTRIKNRSPEMDLIGSCFGNPEEVVWTTMESQMLKSLAPTLDEISLIADFYSYDIPETNGYRNRNVKSLLQNWSAQLISAREFFKQNPDLKTA